MITCVQRDPVPSAQSCGWGVTRNEKEARVQGSSSRKEGREACVPVRAVRRISKGRCKRRIARCQQRVRVTVLRRLLVLRPKYGKRMVRMTASVARTNL